MDIIHDGYEENLRHAHSTLPRVINQILIKNRFQNEGDENRKIVRFA